MKYTILQFNNQATLVLCCIIWGESMIPKDILQQLSMVVIQIFKFSIYKIECFLNIFDYTSTIH